MKSLFFGSLILLSALNYVSAAPNNSVSDAKLKTCLTSVYSNASKSASPAKDTLKLVSSGVKECRQSVATLKKQEREQNKKLKIQAQIQKLQAKLGAN
jgi:hypothetical protein